MNARTICWPNTLYMCCPTGDGAAAVILCSMDKARQFTGKPVRILASAMATPSYTPESLGFVEVATMTRRAADMAYEKAGIGPKDLDLVELHDCFATAELLHYENLHLCEWGEGGRMIEEGRTEIDGDIPVNIERWPALERAPHRGNRSGADLRACVAVARRGADQGPETGCRPA